MPTPSTTTTASTRADALRNILILDTETTGVDTIDHTIEIGMVLWSVEHRSTITVFSTVAVPPKGTGNEAEWVNGIPAGMLANLDVDPDMQSRLVAKLPLSIAAQSDAIVAHNADFDKRFCKKRWPELVAEYPWICTMEDFVWPKQAPSAKLSDIALAHGQAVVAAHRAINDCLMIVRLFESIPDIAVRLEKALAYSKQPKLLVQAKCKFTQNHLAKHAGFRYNSGDDGRPKGWINRMTRDEYELLMRSKPPFPVEIVGPQMKKARG